jgi:hypothetical protein
LCASFFRPHINSLCHPLSRFPLSLSQASSVECRVSSVECRVSSVEGCGAARFGCACCRAARTDCYAKGTRRAAEGKRASRVRFASLLRLPTLGYTVDSFAPAQLALRANLRLVYLAPALALDCLSLGICAIARVFAPTHVALRAAYGRLSGQRPLARIQVSGLQSQVCLLHSPLHHAVAAPRGGGSPPFTLDSLLVLQFH